MENYLNIHAAAPADILCVGLGWFPKTPGGLNRYVCELTSHLAALRDRVELCGVGLPDSHPTSPIQLTNLGSAERPLWQQLWSARRQFLNRSCHRPDAVNLHFALSSFPLLNLLPKGVPVTFTFHGPWALESRHEGGNSLSVFLKQCLVEKSVYRRCDRFIVLSQAFGNILHQTYQVPWHKINVIPGGVDLTRFRPDLSRQEARARLNWPRDRAILFTPRRLVHRMGIDKLLNVLAIVKRQVPDVWLAIAGKGTLRASLEQQATELGLENHVKFLGFLPDDLLPIAYQAAELTVIPSKSLEGFGLVLLESLASGTPPLCTPVGGMPEVLAPFSPDLIAPSQEEGAIAERLQQLLLGEVPLPSREACRLHASTYFDWQKIALRVRQVLLA